MSTKLLIVTLGVYVLGKGLHDLEHYYAGNLAENKYYVSWQIPKIQFWIDMLHFSLCQHNFVVNSNL